MKGSVVIVGDVWPNGFSVRDSLAHLGDIAVSNGAPDLFVYTLDASIAVGAGRPSQTPIAFEPRHLDGLRFGARQIAALADNHVTDFAGGLDAVVRALDERGVLHAGAGPDRNAALRGVDVDVAGRRVRVLSFAEDDPRVGPIAARENRAGVAILDDAIDAVATARHGADDVWVFIHWGREFIRFPDPKQRRTAAALVAAGATLVVGTHAHVPLGHERIGGSDVFYGLGNFLYPGYVEARGYEYRWHRRARRGLVLHGRSTGDRFSWRARLVEHDAHGVPTTKFRAPDTTFSLPLSLPSAVYDRLYAPLAKAEAATHIVERLIDMSPDERRWRLQQLGSCMRRERA